MRIRRPKPSRFPGVLRGNDRGQALVELALTIPLLMLLVLGAVELARAAYAAVEVTNAAEAAVRYGAQNKTTAKDTAGMQLAAQSDAANIAILPFTSTNPSRTCECSDGTEAGSSCTSFSCGDGTATMETLTVTTTANFDTLIHLPGLPSTFTLRGYAVQKVLY